LQIHQYEIKTLILFKDINTGGPIFDQVKLSWINHQYIQKLNADAFADQLQACVFDRAYLKEITPLVIERIQRWYKPIIKRVYENPEARVRDIEHLAEMASKYKKRSTFLAELILDPPASTEQIMHPEKYLGDRDDPTPVVLAGLDAELGAPWHRIDEDVAGEFIVHVWLQHYLDDETAARAAAGWDGDRYHLYEHEETKHVTFVFLSVWDSQADTQEFLEAYQRILEEKYPEKRPLGDHAWQTEAGAVHLERRDHTVLLIEGAPLVSLGAITGSAWNTP